MSAIVVLTMKEKNIGDVPGVLVIVCSGLEY